MNPRRPLRIVTPATTRRFTSSNHNNNNNDHGSGNGNGNNNNNGRRFLGQNNDENGDDDEDHSKRLTWVVGGSGAWLWTRFWNTKDSYATSKSSQVVLAASTVTPVALFPMDYSWKVLLAAALILIQSVGLQAVQASSVALRQGMAWYLTKLNTAPLITKSVTSGVIGMCGDYMAQWLAYELGRRKGDPTTLTSHTIATTTASSGNAWNIYGAYDLRRGLAILADGMFISGPLMHWGYNLFEHLMPVASGRSLAAMAHVVADSVLLDSVFVGTAFVVTGLFEGYGFRKEIVPQFQRDYLNTMKASWATSATLMPLEFVCFRYLPVTFRTLAMNLTDVIWDAVISFMAHRHRTHETVNHNVWTIGN